MEIQTIYQVSCDNGTGGERPMGFASGNIIDIKNYYANYKPFKDAETYIREITVNVITQERAEGVKKLNEEKAQLEERIKQINALMQK